MLHKFFNLLNPGGSILLDVCSIRAFEQRQESRIFEPNLLNGFWSNREYYGFLNIFKYETEKVILDKYTIIETERTRTIYNWLQYFSVDDIKREFSQSGLTIDNIYSDVAGSPYNPETSEFAITARKP